MATWQDGYYADFYSVNASTFTNVERITLPNGQRAYKSDQGVFYPGPNGRPFPRKVPEELIE